MAAYANSAPVRDDFRCSLCRQKNTFHCEHDTPYRDQLLGTYDHEKPHTISSNSRRDPHRTRSHTNNNTSNNKDSTSNYSGQHTNHSGQHTNHSGQQTNYSGQQTNYNGHQINYSGQPTNYSGQYRNSNTDARYQQGRRSDNGSFSNTDSSGYARANELKPKKNKSCVIL